MSLLSQSCAEATRWISESMDARLSLPARVGLRLHLVICRHCRRYRQQILWMHRLLRAYPDRLPSTRLPEDFRRQLTQKLKQEGSP